MAQNHLTLTPKLLRTLQAQGYKAGEAISDLIDNSIDAKATTIRIELIPRKVEGKATNELQSLYIIDNGTGMTENRLKEALTPGSETDHLDTDLGVFGIGLNAAASSFSSTFVVLTKHKNDVHMFGEYDINKMERTNSTAIELRPAKKKEIEFFESKVDGLTGTIILIPETERRRERLADNPERVRALNNVLKRELGLKFRKFISNSKNNTGEVVPADLTIYVNTDRVIAHDPMEPETSEILYSKQHEMKYLDATSGEEKSSSIKIEAYWIRTEQPQQNDQGFYIIRNGRDIRHNDTLGIWRTHPSHNRLRVELAFSSDLDQLFNVNSQKNSIEITQKIHDLLSKIYSQHLRKHITAHISSTPDEKSVKRKPVDKKSKTIKKVMKETREQQDKDNRVRDISKQTPISITKYEHEFVKYGAGGVLFANAVIGDTLVTKINEDSPLFQVYYNQSEHDEAGYEYYIRLLMAFSYEMYLMEESNSPYRDGVEHFLQASSNRIFRMQVDLSTRVHEDVKRG